MKPLILLTMLAVSFNSFATSYWYDYCNEDRLVLEFAKKQNPDLTFDGSCQSLNRLGQPALGTSGKVEICHSELTRLNLRQTRATFKVKVLDPQTQQILSYKLVMKMGRGSTMCKVKSLTLL